ncbi:MAG: hypothetical protein HOC79_01760 [Euryarchaeota archaeon]|nr:hypothetical protein [Euryarchaeota archaeon]
MVKYSSMSQLWVDEVPSCEYCSKNAEAVILLECYWSNRVFCDDCRSDHSEYVLGDAAELEKEE